MPPPIVSRSKWGTGLVIDRLRRQKTGLKHLNFTGGEFSFPTELEIELCLPIRSVMVTIELFKLKKYICTSNVKEIRWSFGGFLMVEEDLWHEESADAVERFSASRKVK